MITETYDRTRDGLHRLRPKKGRKGEALVIYTEAELSAMTALELHYLGTYYHHTEYPSLFDWTTYASIGEIEIDMAVLKDVIVAGDDLVELLAYAADYPNGIVIAKYRLIVTDDVVVE
jgi:hypothetical protein